MKIIVLDLNRITTMEIPATIITLPTIKISDSTIMK